MMHRTLRRRLRQGQGMTEYIIIVGLIAILLIGVVTAFKEQVRVTIEGSDGTGGAVGAVDGISNGINNGGPTDDGGSSAPSFSGGRMTPAGPLSDDGTKVSTANGVQPYDPAVHGAETRNP